MNLIKEINAFYKLDMPGQLSFSAQSLYMALLHTANEIYSRDITPSNGLLMAKTGVKDVKTLEKARQELVDVELIHYISKAKNRQVGDYHIIGLEHLLVDNFRKNSGENPEKFPGLPGKKPPHIQEENREEENNNPPIPPQGEEEDLPVEEKPRKPFKSKKQENQFDLFWGEYPKKKAKGDAEKAWMKITPDDLLFRKIINSLKDARGSPDWIRDRGQYIPFPATWLNGKRWNDEYEESHREEAKEIDWGYQKN